MSDDSDSHLHPEDNQSPSRFSTFSAESSPSQLSSHKTPPMSDYFTVAPDDTLDPLEGVKRAIDSSNDKICGLQDSLVENKNRLAAILGIGTILEKTHTRKNRFEASGIPRCPSTDSKDSQDRSSLFYSNVAEMTKLITEDVHANERMKILVGMINQQLDTQSLASIAGSPSDPERKERVIQVEHLKRDKAKLETQLAEKSKLVLERIREVDRLTAELSKCNQQSTARNNDLIVLQAHVKEIETLIHSVSNEFSEPVAALSYDPADLCAHNSKRFMQMISMLSQLRVSVKNKSTSSRAEYLELETSRAIEIEKLKAQLSQSTASCDALKRENESLSKKNAQLEQTLTDKKAEHASAEAHRNNHELLAMSKEVAALRNQNKDLKEQLAQHHAIFSTKIAGLTGNLVNATEDFQNHINTKTVENKNSEKLIASLEASLDANRKELSLVHSHNATLEAKIAELHKQIQEKKTFVKGMEGEDLVTLRKELHNKTNEVAELRDRNTELALANATYLEQVIQTENNLNTEIVELRDHIANLNLEHNVVCDELRRQVAQLNQQYYSTTARDAEKKVAFTKESIRAHLKANGVKVFHWEDMATLIQKVEDLHNKPNQPIVTVADLVEMVDPEGGEESVPGTPTLQRKKTVASLKSAKSVRSMVKMNSGGSSAGNLGIDTDNMSVTSAQPMRTPNSVKSFRFDTTRSVTSEATTPKKVWNGAKVEKTDPFGDQQKTKTLTKTNGSSKDLLVEKMDLLKKQSSAAIVKTSGGSGSASALKSSSVTPRTAASGGATPRKTVKVASGAASGTVKPANGKKATSGTGKAGSDNEEEEVQPYDEESDTF